MEGGKKKKKIKYESGDSYYGHVEDGQRHGYGIYNFEDGGRYEGEYQFDKRHGKGVLVLADKSRYEGMFHEGKRHGNGKETLSDGTVFTGEFHMDVKQGSGAVRLPDGSEYVGEWRDNAPNGKGRFTFGAKTEWAGDVYEGDMVDGQFHGEGVYTYNRHSKTRATAGDVYVGSYVQGSRTGKGVYSCRDGTTYDGEWIADEREGMGTLTLPNGNKFIGVFENDKRGDTGKAVMADGSSYEGEFRDGLPHGKGVYIFGLAKPAFSGDRVEGEFQEGFFHGLVTYTYSPQSPCFPGAYFKGEYDHGARTGTGVFTFQNHKYEGEFLNGLKSGEGCYTWPDGSTFKGTWADDLMHGQGVYSSHSGGNAVVVTGVWSEGKKNGIFKSTRGGGKVEEVEEWVDGLKRKQYVAGSDVVVVTNSVSIPEPKSFLAAASNTHTGDNRQGNDPASGFINKSLGTGFENFDISAAMSSLNSLSEAERQKRLQKMRTAEIETAKRKMLSSRQRGGADDLDNNNGDDQGEQIYTANGSVGTIVKAKNAFASAADLPSDLGLAGGGMNSSVKVLDVPLTDDIDEEFLRVLRRSEASNGSSSGSSGGSRRMKKSGSFHPAKTGKCVVS